VFGRQMGLANSRQMMRMPLGFSCYHERDQREHVHNALSLLAPIRSVDPGEPKCHRSSGSAEGCRSSAPPQAGRASSVVKRGRIDTARRRQQLRELLFCSVAASKRERSR